ncbi:MAG: CHC2 zinc finger domain-containing protein [Solirubrobacteraceae bacterium]
MVYLEALFGSARPRTLVEVRWRAGAGMRRRFVPVGDLGAVAAAVAELGHAHDVFVGVLPRWRRSGRRADVVGDGRTVWVDLDVEDGLRALGAVDPPPRLAVASGAAGHVHAYWSLRRAAAPGVIERANGRLAFALGGDLGAIDAARILRPPGTTSFKHDRPVELAASDGPALTSLGGLVGGLPDAPGWQRQRAGGRVRRRSSSALENVAPEVYVQRLTGQLVGRSRKVRCPLHEDRTPSLHVYPDAARGWYCFGCRRGGSVFDLAAALWGRELRGREFAALRADLCAVLID